MTTPEYCVYNETREQLLGPRVGLLDPRSEPLKAVKVLIEGLAPNAASGLWLNPLKSIPAVPRLSPYDLVYLDRDGYVVHGVELVPDDEPPRIDNTAASALLLPHHTFAASRAATGDRFVLRRADESNATAERISALRLGERNPAASVSLPSSGGKPEASPQNLPPLAWPPAPPARTALTATPLNASPNSLTPSVALEQVDSLAKLPTPSPRRALQFPFLQTLASLRIRVHISIATAPEMHPVVLPVRPHKRVGPGAARVALTRFAQRASTTLRALRPGTAKTTAFLNRRWTQCKTAYLRWADSFIFRPARKSSSRRPPVPNTPILSARIACARKPRFLR